MRPVRTRRTVSKLPWAVWDQAQTRFVPEEPAERVMGFPQAHWDTAEADARALRSALAGIKSAQERASLLRRTRQAEGLTREGEEARALWRRGMLAYHTEGYATHLEQAAILGAVEDREVNAHRDLSAWRAVTRGPAREHCEWIYRSGDHPMGHTARLAATPHPSDGPRGRSRAGDTMRRVDGVAVP